MRTGTGSRICAKVTSARRSAVAAVVCGALPALSAAACRSVEPAAAALRGAVPDSAAPREKVTAPPPLRPPAHAQAASVSVTGLPKIDVHMHISVDAVPRAVALMDKWGITGGVNLSGMHPGPPYEALAQQIQAAAVAKGRIAVFANANFRHVLTQKDYGRAMADDLEESKRQGAVGLKIPKGLGLGYPAPGGKRLLAVDDAGLNPLFDKAGELGMPVAIHVGDPKAFWKPATPANERWDELGAHPEWSFFGQPVPSWRELYDAFERRVARHKKTIFIAVHFGNDPEDPNEVARMLDKYPNFYLDTAARIPEIGRHDPQRMRRFFEKYQDRILFGSDTGVGSTQDEMMYGSTGSEPATPADETRFFESTWRYFETTDRQFASPTPIQGRWKIDGIGLPPSVLRKVYFENAARILRWRPATNMGAEIPVGSGTAATSVAPK